MRRSSGPWTRLLTDTLLRGLVLFALVLAARADVAAAQERTAAELPVADRRAPAILLTGFEPFGKRKPPNPSWEAVKVLDGREWKGFRLVARQLPVVWRAPLGCLDAWIGE